MSAGGKYRLYVGETACDSDDWGPPRSKHSTLMEAIAVTGIPASKWQTMRYCPDEVHTHWTYGAASRQVWQPQMSILHPGAAAEFEALSAEVTS